MEKPEKAIQRFPNGVTSVYNLLGHALQALAGSDGETLRGGISYYEQMPSCAFPPAEQSRMVHECYTGLRNG